MAGYALNIGDDGRVLSATYDRFGLPGQPRVEALPGGDLSAYDYKEGVLVRNEARAAAIAAARAAESPE